MPLKSSSVKFLIAYGNEWLCARNTLFAGAGREAWSTSHSRPPRLALPHRTRKRRHWLATGALWVAWLYAFWISRPLSFSLAVARSLTLSALGFRCRCYHHLWRCVLLLFTFLHVIGQIHSALFSSNLYVPPQATFAFLLRYTLWGTPVLQGYLRELVQIIKKYLGNG